MCKVSFTRVQGGSTIRISSNLLEPHHCRDSKVCRVLSHEFVVVRLYQNFSNYIFTGEARCVWCLSTSLGWFKRIEPPRTFSNHILAELARCVEFFHMSSDSTEPSLTTSLQGKQGVHGAYALVRGGSSTTQSGSSTSNLFEPSRTTLQQKYQGVQIYFTGVRGCSTLPNLL